MSRNIDKDFSEELKNYLKLQWMKNGQQPFSKTLKEISIDMCGEEVSAFKNKIHLYLPKLENAGYIKITKGLEKGNPNWYTWINDNIVQQLNEQREETMDTIEDFLTDANQLIQKANNIYRDLSQKLTAVAGELHIYKQLISDLELFSTTTDGNQILLARKGVDAISIINSVKQKNKENDEQENNQEYNQG